MTPSTNLKISSIALALLWTVFMLVWSGAYDHVNIGMLALGGGLTGYAWYRAVRWQLARRRVPPRRRRIDPAKGIARYVF